MLLTVLGCRAGMPADGQPSSGYLVRTPGARVLLDCGPGTATALGAHLPPWGLDAVVISHFHSDHCYDLLPIGKSLLTRLVEVPGGPAADAETFRPVPLYVPGGARELFRRWSALFPVTTMPLLDKAFEVAFDVREYRPGDRFTVGDCTAELRELRHVQPNCGIRLTSAGGSLAYTGDTGPTPVLAELAAGADVLLAEATLTRSDVTAHGHLSGADAGRAAARAGVGRLVLTHFASVEPDWLSGLAGAASREFAGPVTLAEPGMTLAVRDPGRSE
ncbi:MBL fold metallo-hydrolase [Actinosynnema sp. NPDC047251]|uniref:Beta-lactamase domain protein n=1 Tax=Saccharothrix espanaensis (strain ATCC 51144 / DSM 44229 / JCM 9112 / NBRC 15066 / NRRL 15764) TaxID=1179773 RepID=K0K0J1_SACES|nr:MBL fold metallo-hydrolase [Saccharothrix espanaensis]CCH31042.1 beta-lactamase domain protein [Saccharothrix espanaensis DSM 44229]